MSHILVVDDTKADRVLAMGLLRNAGASNLLEASGGEAALELLAEHDVDVVVTDMQMPEMDGFELVTEVNRLYPDVPVVLMTARGSEAIAVRALQQGAASYVPKDNLQRDLVQTVERVLGAAYSERERARLMSQLVRTDSQFSVENDPGVIVALVNHLREQLDALGLRPKADLVRVTMALQEALFNAYFHGNLRVGEVVEGYDPQRFHEVAEDRRLESPYADRRIAVSVKCTPEQAVYVIRDEGPGFEHANLPDPDDPHTLDEPTGRGIVLMQSFVDEVRYNDAGNEVTLLVRRRDPV
jgi:CheY-like chemotaxis protein/anti-sigma regulatory factor (Ser/Thr protein kinase)